MRPVLIYFFWACFFSWIIFILLALNHHRYIFLFTDDAAHARIADLFHSFGGLGPTIGAIIICIILFGKHGWKKLTAQLSLSKMNRVAWILALSPVTYLLIALPIDYLINKKWYDWNNYFITSNLNETKNLVYWLMPSIFYGLFEEPGWRGFLLPWLQRKYPAFKATVLLTLFWFIWHLPSFFYRYQLSLPMMIGFATGLFAGAVVLTFLYNYTRGSLLAVMIWHLAWDLVSIAGKEGNLSAIMSAVIMVLAFVILVLYKWDKLSPFSTTSFGDHNFYKSTESMVAAPDSEKLEPSREFDTNIPTTNAHT